MTAMTTDLMTIRAMCEAFDVTPRTLRFYEAKELLFPQRQGTRRLFTARDRARLTQILRGKTLGFSLEEIRQLLETRDRDGAMAEAVATMALAEQRLNELQSQRAELDASISALTALLTQDLSRPEPQRSAA